MCANCKERWESSHIIANLANVDWFREDLTSEVCLYKNIQHPVLLNPILETVTFYEGYQTGSAIKALYRCKKLGICRWVWENTIHDAVYYNRYPRDLPRA